MMRALGAALLIIGLAGCSAAAPANAPPATSAWEPLTLRIQPFAPRLSSAGARVAGAWTLTSTDNERLHGLSDLKLDDDRLLLVSDNGDLVEMTPPEPPAAEPVTQTARMRRLPGKGGGPLRRKQTSDAEGLVVLPDRQLLVSFERRHRITLYGRDGSLARPATTPAARFAENRGLEAISLADDGGWWAASEDGRLWLCPLGDRCRRQKARLGGAGVLVTGMDRDPRGGALYVLTREVRPGGFATTLWRLDPKRVGRADPGMSRLARLEGGQGLGDNFEGVAAERTGEGALRLWLVSDDGFRHRTALVVLDLP